jgi:hypothetical protein
MLVLPLIWSRHWEVSSKQFRASSEQSPLSYSGGASALPHIVRDVDAMVDDNLLFRHSTPSTTYERMMDPMLLEALLMNQRRDMEEDSSILPSADSTPHVINHHPSPEDISTSALPRSEAEQLVCQELIKALRDFKQLMVAPSTPYSQ